MNLPVTLSSVLKTRLFFNALDAFMKMLRDLTSIIHKDNKKARIKSFSLAGIQ